MLSQAAVMIIAVVLGKESWCISLAHLPSVISDVGTDIGIKLLLHHQCS